MDRNAAISELRAAYMAIAAASSAGAAIRVWSAKNKCREAGVSEEEISGCREELTGIKLAFPEECPHSCVPCYVCGFAP